MNKTFLKVSATILFVVLILKAVLTQFGMLSFMSSHQRVVATFVLFTLFIGSLTILRRPQNIDDSGTRTLSATTSSPDRTIRFSLRRLLSLVTVVALLLGLAQAWPLPGLAAIGTFLCRIPTPALSLRNTVLESFIWSALTVILFSTVQIESQPRPTFGFMCLSVILGAAIGVALAFPFQEKMSFPNGQVKKQRDAAFLRK